MKQVQEHTRAHADTHMHTYRHTHSSAECTGKVNTGPKGGGGLQLLRIFINTAVRRASDRNGVKERGRRENEYVKVGLAGKTTPKSIGFRGDGLNLVPGGQPSKGSVLRQTKSSLDQKAEPVQGRSATLDSTQETDLQRAISSTFLCWNQGRPLPKPRSRL